MSVMTRNANRAGAVLQLILCAAVLATAACGRPSAAQSPPNDAYASAGDDRPVVRTAYVSDANGNDIYIYSMTIRPATLAFDAEDAQP